MYNHRLQAKLGRGLLRLLLLLALGVPLLGVAPLWAAAGQAEGAAAPRPVDPRQIVPVEATAEPLPTAEPTTEPTTAPSPTVEATSEPLPTAEPTSEPLPTAQPTTEPTAAPSPTEEATSEPRPTTEPTDEPTTEPTTAATPTAPPTLTPTPVMPPTPMPPPVLTPTIQVWLVDFAVDPALQIIRDRLKPNQDPFGRDSHQKMEQFAAPCDNRKATDAKHEAEWKDCQPDGQTEKNWPLAYVKGSQITLKEVRFKVSGAQGLKNVKVSGTAKLGDKTLTFTTNQAVAQQGDEIVATTLTSGNLPDTVNSFKPMTINWQIEVNDQKLAGGQSSHPLYLLWKKPAFPLYLTIVDFTTEQAKGKDLKEELEVVEAIWPEFTDREVKRRELNPATGEISVSQVQLQYWFEWTVMTALERQSLLVAELCNGGTAELLYKTKAMCGVWAGFMVDALKTQGVSGATNVSAGSLPDFPRGPLKDPKNKDTFVSYLMLIRQWRIPNGVCNLDAGKTTYDVLNATRILLANGTANQVVIGQQAFQDQPGLPGQGGIKNPPGWFQLGDHNMVKFEYMNKDGKLESKLYDPSYGTGPFKDIKAWAAASLAGYAKVEVTKFDPQTGKQTLEISACAGIP